MQTLLVYKKISDISDCFEFLVFTCFFFKETFTQKSLFQFGAFYCFTFDSRKGTKQTKDKLDLQFDKKISFPLVLTNAKRYISLSSQI